MSDVLLGPRDMLALSYITRNLRAVDRVECIEAMGSTPDSLAAATYAAGEFQWIAWAGSKPVAVIGCGAMTRTVWQAFAFGTEDWPLVALSLTKHIRRVMIPSLLDAGATRVQAFAHGENDKSIEWLCRSCGAQRGQDMRGYGVHGQTFVMMEWTRDDAHRMMETTRGVPRT